MSFISLSLILPALHRVLADQGQVVALIKPQFEAGREQIGKMELSEMLKFTKMF